jgi:hypothetical protein
MSTFLHMLLPHPWWITIFAALIYATWCIFEGEREALYFTRLNPNKFGPNPDPHRLFAAQRLMVLLSLAMSCGATISVSAALIFPFLHDGMYYNGRHSWNNDVYKQGWKSEPSDTSTALMDISYRTRTIMFLAGLVLWVGTTWYAYAH